MKDKLSKKRKILLGGGVIFIIVAVITAGFLLLNDRNEKDKNSGEDSSDAYDQEQDEDKTNEEQGQDKENEENEDKSSEGEAKKPSASSGNSGSSGKSEGEKKPNSSGSSQNTNSGSSASNNLGASNSGNAQKPQEPQKPALQITGHVSYNTPTDCPYTDTYNANNNTRILVYNASGKTVLIKGNNVIGINVVLETPCFVKLWNDDLIFVWQSKLKEYLENNEEKWQSYGSQVPVPGNKRASLMIKSYDAIVPMNKDTHYEYYG